jgi:uncharacterized membrane protein YgdD (TMEM256/DUF423 family)
MRSTTFFRAGALVAGLAVAIGAFGAHALQNLLLATGRADTFDTAVRYQMYHALALLFLGLAAAHYPQKILLWVGRLFIAGIIIFSGSLYLLCLLQLPILGAITPIGGVCFISGWLLLLLNTGKVAKAA